MGYTEAKRVRELTDFGKEVGMFLVDTGLHIKTIAKLCNISYNTLNDTRNGRCAGHEVKPKVREFMRKYREEMM